MNIIFLGYAVAENDANILSGASVAGNKMQINILRQLKEYDDINIKAITVYPVAVYPKDKKIIYKKETINLFKGLDAVRVGFLNAPVIKQLSQMYSVYRQLKRELKQVSGNTVILSFNLYPQVGTPMMRIKKKYGVQTVSVLADPPIDHKIARKGISKWLRGIFDGSTKKNIALCDRLIVLNAEAARRYAPDTEYIVVEGGVNLHEYNLKPVHPKKKKNIVYSGSLNKYSGIDNAAKAFEYIKNQDITLEIYGDGELREDICRIKDKRIRYMGKVSNEEMKNIQAEAWLLINPRPVDDEIALMTFPSKLFEYLISGTPVLTTKLNGLMPEYLDNLFYIEDNSPETIAGKINEIYSMDDGKLLELAENARRFIRTEKSWEKQGEHIYEFLAREKDDNDTKK